MLIREFDSSPADYAAIVHITNTVWPEHTITMDDLQQSDADFQPPFVRRRFLAGHDGQVVGHSRFEHRENMYHPQRFWLSLEVSPAHRRQGIGTALYDHMLNVLQSAYDANELHITIPDRFDDGIHFVTRRGFQEVQRQVESRLQTAAFDWGRYRGIDERMVALGIEIESLRDLITRDEAALYKVYELHQALVQDVPSPVKRTQVDFDSWRDGYSPANPSFLPEANAIAVHKGVYVGLSSLWGDPSSDKLYTGMTGVKAAHRRQGVATALKLRGIAFAQAHDIPLLITHNKGQNPMLQLNLKLGFVRHSADIMLMRRLEA